MIGEAPAKPTPAPTGPRTSTISETFEDIGSAVITVSLIAYLGLKDVKALTIIFTIILPLIHSVSARYFQDKP